ncbi:hypothetical protein SCHPADRAFT_977477 [Schizopora paradoxa]|uniref:Glutaminase A N-terminal domain-containing protein n=1 Tax=Schizopora paradoxa TaxID=27342 RepID=A0A0H2S0E3_9AGAM|nr:hypothetical protein SCHPADRAFT_977477 [Schizopora paradoxa]
MSTYAEARIEKDRTRAICARCAPMIVCPDLLVKLVTLLSIHRALAQTTLPAWPLAVKAPFFNSWYVGGEVSVPLSSSSPINWSFEDMGWYCAIIVDGIAFRLMGADEDPPIEPAKQLAVELTPTRTIFAMQAGPVLVNLMFFTPVTPTDLVRQSIPFSYLYASVKSSDASMHSVNIYSDVLLDWVTGNASLPVVSNGVVENDIVILSSQLTVPQAFTTVGGTMYDGTIYYATSTTNAFKVTYQIGSDVRASAMSSSGLSNTVQSSSPNSSTNQLGLLVDFGDVSTEVLSTVWAIGFYRDPVVQLASSGPSLCAANTDLLVFVL